MPRLSRLVPTAIAFTLSILILTNAVPPPASAQEQDLDPAQCLSREECRALKEQLREFKRQLRPLRRERRELRLLIEDLPDGEERDALIEEARQLHREIKQIKRQRRPVNRRFRIGCRPECFRA